MIIDIFKQKLKKFDNNEKEKFTMKNRSTDCLSLFNIYENKSIQYLEFKFFFEIMKIQEDLLEFSMNFSK